MPGAKACLGCGRSIPVTASYCSDACADGSPDAPQRPAVGSRGRRANPGGHWSPDRVAGTQHAFREKLIHEFGERCMAIGAYPPEDPFGEPWAAPYPAWMEKFTGLTPGQRCPRTTRLQAHHGKDGMPDMLLCGTHHSEIDLYARGT